MYLQPTCGNGYTRTIREGASRLTDDPIQYKD